MDSVFDVVIIGGGINGCGCAADAALRGLSVLLIEQDDLASKTSSSSSKLIHGGLRYLEYLNFKLVKKALNERQLLLKLAPHLIHPLAIVLPYKKKLRPLAILRAGLFLYDHLSASNRLPHSKLIHRARQVLFFNPLIEQFKKGFLFYDCAADDARLTLDNALQAKAYGANIMTQTKLIKAETIDSLWHLTLQKNNSSLIKVTAKSVINASGPWVESVNQLLNVTQQHTMALIKGSHIVVHRLYEGEHAYLLQHDDHRVIFVVPYQGHTMIGTTDTPLIGKVEDVSIDASEIDYFFELIKQYFNHQLHPNDIINTWSGVRPLLSTKGKSSAALSRDYMWHFSQTPAPVITIYSGKITTYRQLAKEVIDKLKNVFPTLPNSLTNVTPLPGAILNTMPFNEYECYAREKYYWLDETTLQRYLNTYGTLTEIFLDQCKNPIDLGLFFGDTLYQIEVDYLMHHEWAKTIDDILWRRTKLGLRLNSEEQHVLEHYIMQTQSHA